MRFRHHSITAIVAFALYFCVPSMAAAHLAGGMDVTVAGYILDFGWDPAPPLAPGLTTFAFNIIEESSDTQITPTSVWVNMSQGSHVVFAGTLHPTFGSVNLMTLIDQPGKYDVEARYSLGEAGTVGAKELRGKFSFVAEASNKVPNTTTGKDSMASGAPASQAQIALVLALAAVTFGVGLLLGRRRPS